MKHHTADTVIQRYVQSEWLLANRNYLPLKGDEVLSPGFISTMGDGPRMFGFRIKEKKGGEIGFVKIYHSSWI